MADTRMAILEAAAQLILSGRSPHLRVADVAAAARVSRQTVYNEFGSRDGLLVAFNEWQDRRFRDEVVRAARTAKGDVGDAVGAAMMAGLDAAAEDPLVKAGLTHNAADFLPFMTTRSGTLITMLRDSLTEVLLERWPHLDPVDTRWVVELCARLGISHVVMRTEPTEITAAHTGVVVRRLLGARSNRT